jgi:hypothetical protein
LVRGFGRGGEARRPQLEDELHGVDHVGGTRRERAQQLRLEAERSGNHRDDIGGVQRDDAEADDIFPEEGGG